MLCTKYANTNNKFYEIYPPDCDDNAKKQEQEEGKQKKEIKRTK